MYKLVAIGGILRGQEFNLEEGENILGRDSACNINFLKAPCSHSCE
jgi:hypothetical protein